MPLVLQHVIEVVDAPTEGALSAVLPTLRRRLTVLSRDADLIRVGVTNDVDRRAGNHRAYGFDWFVVLWETTSRDRVAEAEALLIEHARWKGLPLAGGRRCGGVGVGPRFGDASLLSKLARHVSSWSMSPGFQCRLPL